MSGAGYQGEDDLIENIKASVENESALGGPKFLPPLYIQRYSFVREILEKHKIKNVVDFGSAECKILNLMKTVETVQSIALVDLDNNLLECVKFHIRPLLNDYLHRRGNPLTVRLFHGNAAVLDERIVGYEAATMVEMIEHLHDSDLQAVTKNIFGNLEPRLVIITTPNADFNQLFPGFSGFRHWDHKFEWTQDQFQSWCQAICDCYDYRVEFTGIGLGPPGSEHLGFCSQAAVFHHKFWSSSVDPLDSQCYRLIAESVFPVNRDILSPDEKLAVEVTYYLHYHVTNTEREEEGNSVTVPIATLLRYRSIQELCDIEKLRCFLRNKYTLSKDEESVIVNIDNESENDNTDSDWVLEDGEDILSSENISVEAVQTGSGNENAKELWD